MECGSWLSRQPCTGASRVTAPVRLRRQPVFSVVVSSSGDIDGGGSPRLVERGMEAVAYSWLAAASCSPLLIMLALWTTYVFHSYRRQWRMVDLFFLAVVVQELMASSLAFAFAVLQLINPRLEPVCVFLQWGLTATRAFQLATLASLAVDRCLTVRWPYRYRLSVRRNQIRYHIAVLAVVSVFVGVAAVFARVPGGGPCSVRPSAWDYNFSVFLLCLYSVLVLTAGVCGVRSIGGGCRRPSPRKEPPPGMDFGTSGSGTGSSSSGGSCRPLRPPPSYRQRSATLDTRWTAVCSVCLCCYAVNHLPFLVFNAVSLADATFWNAWQENIVAWLRLLESLLIPAILYFTDLPHRGAVKKAFQRKSGRFSQTDGADDRMRPYLDDILNGAKMGPGNQLSSFRPANDLAVARHLAVLGNRPSWQDHILSNLYSLPPHPSAFGKHAAQAGNYLSRPARLDNDLPEYPVDTWKEDGSHIYASLSESFRSVSIDDQLDLAEDGQSVTTDANDDFEFHQVRPSPYPRDPDPSEEPPEYSVDSCSDSDHREIEICHDQFLQVYKMSREQWQHQALTQSCSLDDLPVSSDDEQEEEIYVLPVAPRSSMALYKLQLPPPHKARSENDLTWLCQVVDSFRAGSAPSERTRLDNDRSAILAALDQNAKRNVKRRTSLKESVLGAGHLVLSGFV